MRFATCAILSFLCVSIDHSHEHLKSIRAALSVLVYPIQVVATAPANAVQYVSSNLSSRQHLIAENRRLAAENLRLSSHAQRFAALENENMRLRELLDSSVVFDQDVLVADILAIETTPAARQVVVNKGANHGVYVGQPMLDAHGIIGQVSEVGPFSSTALLITDPRHAIPVIINRNGLRAIAVGSAQSDKLELSFVSTNADIAQGDLVVTSGLGRRFPAGYPVGRISKIGAQTGESFVEVLVDPSGKVGHTQEVLLIGPRPLTHEQERVTSVVRW